MVACVVVRSVSDLQTNNEGLEMPRRGEHTFENTETGRPVSRSSEELLELVRIGAGLRICEIHTLAVASGEDVMTRQQMNKIEASALRKFREAFEGLDFTPEPRRHGKRGRTACQIS